MSRYLLFAYIGNRLYFGPIRMQMKLLGSSKLLYLLRFFTLQQKVRPRCGRAVGFDAGDYHGVQAVTSGRRCALAAWYTLDPIDQEMSHAQARTILHKHEFRNKKR